jgi:hypothetical protein
MPGHLIAIRGDTTALPRRRASQSSKGAGQVAAFEPGAALLICRKSLGDGRDRTNLLTTAKELDEEADRMETRATEGKGTVLKR